jgi:hypothetical protein
VILLAATITLLYLVWFKHLHDMITLVYISLLLAVPMIVVIIRVLGGRDKKHLHFASLLMKLVMLAGILYSLVAGAIISSGKIL